MIQTLLVQEPSSKIILFYSNRTTESTIFKDEIDKLCKTHSDNLTVKHFVNGNRLAQDDISNYSNENDNFECYICGPESLKSVVRLYLKNEKVDEIKIHTEDFVDGSVPWFGLFK